VNEPKVGRAAFTVSVVLTLPLLYDASASCAAVIVLVPAPVIVTILDEIVATFGFDDMYVNAPDPFEDGSTRLNETSFLNVFVEIVASAPIVGVNLRVTSNTTLV
jgi:hypothetical protein